MVTIIDLFLIPVAYLYIFGVIYLASSLKIKGRIDGPLARKVVHLGIGILVIIAPLLFSSNQIPTMIGISFICITFVTSPISPVVKWRVVAFKDGHGLGTVYYSISLTLLLYYFFPTGWIIQVGFLPLVFGDAFANIVGRSWGRHKWPGGNKSIEGSIAGILASWLILILALSVYLLLDQYPGSFGGIVILGLLISLIMGTVELVSPFGLDNLTIPFFCTLGAIYFQTNLL